MAVAAEDLELITTAAAAADLLIQLFQLPQGKYLLLLVEQMETEATVPQQELVELVQLLYKGGQLTFKLLADKAHQVLLVVVVVTEEVVLYL